MRVARLLERREVERLLARRRLPHRQRHLGREHEVDLLVEDAILLRHGDRDEEDAEDVVAVRLERRPWSWSACTGGGDEPLERARVQRDRGLGEELLPRGVEQVDPARRGPPARG